MDILDWIKNYRKKLNFNIEKTSINKIPSWNYLDDFNLIARNDNAFFSIRAIQSSNVNGNLIELPLIDQPEIGILGFVITKDKKGTKILLHAKSEPGNVNLTQIGPSVQATESNYKSKHGGKPQAYIDFFLNKQYPKIIAIKQSEQGNRFLNKYNLNTIVEVEDFIPVNEEKFKWFYLEEIISNLNKPYLFNTDFKSVFSQLLESIVNNIPTQKRNTPLLKSYFDNINSDFQSNIGKLNSKREKHKFSIYPINLDQMKGWELNDTGLIPKDKYSFGYRFFEIEIKDREVPHWGQPLITKDAIEKIELLCFEQNEGLLFIFKERIELGFKNIIQLGPTIQYDYFNQLDMKEPAGNPLIQFVQSEEGGRFYKNISEYKVSLVNSKHEFTKTEGYHILNLYQICQLLKVEGIFTNEARNIIASLVGLL